MNMGGPGGATDVALHGKYAYVAGAKGLYVFDVTDPQHPLVGGNYQDAVNPLNGFDVNVQENYAFLVQSNTGLTTGRLSLINVSNKDAPVEVSSYTPGP
jgi:hypothetical protein